MSSSGITLHRNVELGLDKGYIAIIPVPEAKNEISKWKCILVDESMRKATCLRSYSGELALPRPRSHEVKWGVSQSYKNSDIYLYTDRKG
jgi:hypothetical protein